MQFIPIFTADEADKLTRLLSVVGAPVPSPAPIPAPSPPAPAPAPTPAPGPSPSPAPAPTGAVQFVRLTSLSEGAGNPWTCVAELNVIDANGAVIPRAGWSVTVDSQETQGENGAGVNAIDGNGGTFWHTQWFTANPPLPHSITVNMGAARAISGFRYLPRPGGGKGGIKDWLFHSSTDGITWSQIASGAFTYDAAEKTVLFGVAPAPMPPVPLPAPPATPTVTPLLPLPNAATLFGDMVGLGVKFQQGQPLTELPALVDLGVKWIRSDVWFADFNATTGVFAPNSTVQAMAAFCAANNIGFVALLQIGSFDPVVFARFSVEVAKYLKTTGARFVIELGNEPHNSGLAAQFGGSWQGAGPAAWLVQYVALVNASVQALKALDPAIKMLSDDDMWIVSYWMLQAGLSTGLTGMAFHPYPGGADRPEQTAVQWNTDWCAPFQVVDADSSFGSAVRRLRAQGLAKLGHNPELWATEMGFNQAGGAAREALVASLVPRAFILASESGIDTLCWFSAQDGPDGPMGLKDNLLVKRPSYNAFKTMTQQLSAYKRAVRIAGAAHSLVGIQAFVLDGATDRKVVVWTADSTTVSARSPAPISSAVVDVFGTVRQNDPIMAFTGSPIYFTTQSTDAQLATWAATL